MNRQTISALGLGPALALAAVVLLTSCKKNEPVVAAPVAPPPVAPQGLPPPGMPQGLPQGLPPPGMALGQMGGSAEQRIAELLQVVAREPKNARAWTELGNLYFDTQQRQRSVDAYAKALELQPNNPDVLTDQGVMYRDLGLIDKAEANFKKANQLDPKHMQSLFNLGVVQAHDLKDPQKAIQTWNQVIAASPTSPQAAQARQAIQALQQPGPGAR